jgi:ABC-type nitrate/sulfonate/bicarbonate transport system permease component
MIKSGTEEEAAYCPSGTHIDRDGGMTNPDPSPSAPSALLPDGPTVPSSGRVADRWFALRRELPTWQAVLMGLAGIFACFALWWWVTRGAPEERIISPSKGLSSPGETFASFHSLWFERALTRNLLTTLRRLALGFGMAALVGVPLGVLCGCFPRVQAFFLPMTLFGRNIPVAALIPLTFSLFGIGELQKVVFIFIACVAFVVWDTARAIQEVGSEYIDTAYTLGAGTWQTIGKVLLPLALPSVFNSLRLIFGLAFGYIMLAEVVKFGGETGGLGDLINISQRRGPREHVLLILLIIPVVALCIDRLFFTVQAELFPHRYGGTGILHRLVRAVLHAWEDLHLLLWKALKGLFGQRTPANPTDLHTP